MILNSYAKHLNARPKENSKTQQQYKENPKSIKYIACKNCHTTGVTLIKGPDSYYCKFCYDKMIKKEGK